MVPKCAIPVHIHQNDDRILIEVIFEMQAPTVNLIGAANAVVPLPGAPENPERVPPEPLTVSDFRGRLSTFGSCAI